MLTKNHNHIFQPYQDKGIDILRKLVPECSVENDNSMSQDSEGFRDHERDITDIIFHSSSLIYANDSGDEITKFINRSSEIKSNDLLSF